MPIYNATSSGGTLRASNQDDTVNGSAQADKLFGLGGNDVIFGGAGDDYIEGDGVVTLSDALSLTGYAVLPYSGSSGSGSKPSLTALGINSLGQSIWNIRNTSDKPEVIMLQSASNGNNSFGPFYYTVPPHSDLVVVSNNPSVHKLYFAENGTNYSQVDVVNPKNATYSDTTTVINTGIDGNDTLYGGDGNDTIKGQGGNDVLHGDAGNDALDGGTGNDVLDGGKGADTLIGGDGVDTADYSSSMAGVDVNLVTGLGKGGDAEADKLSGIENLTGSKFNDTLTGDAGANVIGGGSGDDMIAGGKGADTLTGGDGVDTVSFANATEGVALAFGAMDSHGIWEKYANQVAGGYAGEAQGDSYSGFEVFVGSNYQDFVGGGTTAMTFYLGGGNDAFDTNQALGFGVVDTVYGGDGDDIAWGGTGNDVFYGGTGNDTLFGEEDNDVLSGDQGNDALYGGTGNDTLTGGQGADKLDGGSGVDTADYSASGAGVNVNLVSGKGLGGDAEGDALSSIENLVGSKFNDVLMGDQAANTLDGGAGDDVLVGGAGADKLVGGDGIDTADYSASSGAVLVNLETGIGKGGDAEGDTLSGIENLIGSKFNDVLTGNGSTNMIEGGEGDDTITGGSNDDKLYGGAGNDLFLVEWSYHGDTYDGGAGIDTFSADVPVLDGYAQEIDLATGTNNWEDHFVNIENLIGGVNNDKFWGTDGDNGFWGRAGNDLLDGRGGNDSLYGEAGNDTLFGGAGNDVLDGGTSDDMLAGGAGADTLIGGEGIDTADYSKSSAGVIVNLTTGLGSGGDAQGDTLSQIENIIGSAFNDKLTGDVGANVMRAGDGTDMLVGSGGGDVMDGGTGNDTADYSNSNTGVNVNLATGVGSGGYAAGDTLISIENLVGSKFADVLTGDGGANVLRSGDGDDVLIGSGGGDVMDGGAGDDTADYSSSNAGLTVNLAMGVGKGGYAENDTLVSIENVKGSKFEDVLTGDANANVLRAGEGNDVLVGSGGGDIMDGGVGNDTADYSNSTAGVSVNLATGSGQGGFAQGDVLSGIENLVGSKFDDVLTGDASANTLRAGEGNDVLVGSGGGDIMDGGAGSDTADYSNSTAGVTVNLLTGLGQGGFAQGDKLGSIENLTGSAFNDVLAGDLGSNVLTGGAGSDILIGGAGADKLLGGDGVDMADYSASVAAVQVNLVTGLGSGGDAQGDILANIENLNGSSFNDVLVGDSASNALYGGAGHDWLVGGAGADALSGGAGIDTADYSSSGAGVSVSLLTGLGTGGDAEGDVLTGVEYLIGSKFNDTLTGDSGSNAIYGGDGNDHLYGTGGGDLFDGGAGKDWIDYRKSTAAVYVNLAAGVGMGGFAQGDTYVSIENIRGSAFGDTLIGNDAANVIYGGAGADHIEGGGGNDMIYTGGGYDTVDGGAGVDTINYSDSWDKVTVNLLTGIGQYGSASRDALVNFENVIGSKFDDTITGSAGDNKLDGGAGNDVIRGGDGNDLLVGGAGADAMDGGAGLDAASYADATEAVWLSLATGGTAGDAAGDTFVGIENVLGSAFDDRITGDGGDNRLFGGLGNDWLNGGAGIDYLYGDQGNDTLNGGNGADVFVFTTGMGNDTIADFWAGAGRTDRVWLQGVGIISYADVLAHAVDTAAGVVISFADQGTLTLSGIKIAQLNADDFLFA